MVKFFKLSYILEDAHKIFGKRTSILKGDRDSIGVLRILWRLRLNIKQNMGDCIFLGSMEGRWAACIRMVYKENLTPGSVLPLSFK